MIAAVVAACFLVLPGYAIAAFTKRQDSERSTLVDTIVWSTFLTSAVFWFWPLHALRLDTWFFVCLALSAIGLAAAIAFFVAAVVRRRIALPQPARIPLIVALAAVFAFILVNLVIRPAIDWDAVNYYLFVAIGFVSSGHVGMTLPTSIIITPNTPNGITPLVPTLYAVAIEGAAFFHDTTEACVHLMPFVFFAGTVAATRRLAARFMPDVPADAAALFIAIMPAIVNYYVGNPLYVDGATVFFLAALANELYGFNGDRLQGARIGALLTLLILSKANGFVLVAFVIVVLLAGALGKMGGRILAGAFAIALVAAAGVLHEYDAVSSPGLWVAIPIVAAACAVFVTPVKIESGRLRRELAWIALFAVPGLFYVYSLSSAAGSPAGFFVPSLIAVHTPNYHWALHALSLGALYSAASQPGLPENYAAGLLLWWGFSPFFNVLAVIGGVLAYKYVVRARPIVLLVLFFYLGWLTIFNLTSFRHLLPVLPLIAVLAALGLWRLVGERATAVTWAALAACVLSIPFAWTGQVGMYLPPMLWLYALSMDPYHALSGQALLWTSLFLVSVCGCILIARRALTPLTRLWAALDFAALFAFAAAVALALYTNVAGALVTCALAVVLAAAGLLRRSPAATKKVGRWAAPAAALLTVAAVFEPLIAAAISPGLPAQAAAVRNAEDFGYVPALEQAMNIGPGSGSILTYQGYGVTWYSSGQYRRIDLTDAFDLGALKNEIQQPDAQAFVKRLTGLGTFAAILPARSNKPRYASYRRMMMRAHLPALRALDDPLIAPIVYESRAWDVRRVLASSTVFDRNARMEAVSSGGTLRGLALRVPASWSRTGATIDVEASALDKHRHAIEHFTYHDVRPAAPAMLVTPDAIFRSAHLSESDRTKTAYVSIVAAQYAQNGSERILDWRSPHFLLKRRGNAWIADRANMRFYLHPETAPVAYVDLSSKADDPRSATLYPNAVQSDEDRAYGRLDVGLRFSSVCPKGSPMQLEAASSAGILHVGARAGDSVAIPLAKIFGRSRSSQTLDSITVRGLSPACAVSQRLAGNHVKLSPRKHRYRLRGTVRALVVTQLSVP